MPRAKKARKPVESRSLPRSFERTALGKTFTIHRPSAFLGGWTLEMVAAAREAHVAGRFRQSMALCTKMLSDAAIYAAALNRLAPHRGLPRSVCCDDELKGTAANILEEAIPTFASNTSSALPPGVLADAFEHLAMPGISIAQTHWEPRPDGSRLDAFVSSFPLEAVEWSEIDRCLIANTVEEGRVRIEHGDGRWIVSAMHADRPWRWGGVIPLANVLASRPFAIQARGSNANSHGDDKWIGTLPQGMAIKSPEGDAFLDELAGLYEPRRVMIKPHGSEVKREEAMGQNWQIFKEILDSDNKDAQRILLGQDGTMTNSGGDYIKSWGMFGVRNDIVEGDLTTEGAAISTGLLRPWSILNFGRWDRLRFHWVMPDADADARAESIAKRRAAFWTEIESAKRNGCIVDQPFFDRIAKSYSIEPPKLAPDPAALSNGPPAEPSTVVPHRKPLRAAIGS